jgi:hypothetical protein
MISAERIEIGKHGVVEEKNCVFNVNSTACIEVTDNVIGLNLYKRTPNFYIAPFRPASFVGANLEVLECSRLHHVSIFIFAPFEDRVRRKLQIHNTAEPENLFDRPTVEKQVKHIDKQRRRYYEFYTDNKWGGRDEYDLLINTSRAGVEGAVDIIEAYIKGGKDKDLMSDITEVQDL